MPWKILTIVLLLICIGLIIYIWNPGEIFKEKRKEPVVFEPEQRPEMWVPFDFSAEGRISVEARLDSIKIELEQMSGDLTDDRIRKISNFFRKSGYIETHDGKKKIGREIRDYLAAETENISSIKFKLNWFLVEEDTEKLNLPIEEQTPKDVIHYLWIELKLEYVHKGKIIDPEGGRGDRHIRDCNWIG